MAIFTSIVIDYLIMSQASVSTSQLIENTKTNVNALGGSWQVIISQYKGPALKSNLI